MPDTLCQGCGVIGFVRRELILHGDTLTVEYTCKRCDHVWQSADERRLPDRRMAPMDRRKTAS